ncbi:MAG: S-adenosylmethionine:tRNA ribosyltransferase-isomerase, partial [Candidatus Electrothrix sp. ATG1]|nr:S-adenosylmethionine:tRNA ribosyltransferase-isomerase [Candidatus Electrothrix sp. ATG1]
MSKGNETAEDAVQELYRLSSYDYPLPEHLIAQQPAKQRDQSRLLVLDCVNNSRRHTLFNTLCELITPGDLLVINNTKVFPARLLGRKETGGKVETLLLHFPAQIQTKGQECQATTLALIKSSKRPKPGTLLLFSDSLQARVEVLLPDGKAEIKLFFSSHANLEQLLEQHGEIPLPPYIKRPEGSTTEDA